MCFQLLVFVSSPFSKEGGDHPVCCSQNSSRFITHIYYVLKMTLERRDVRSGKRSHESEGTMRGSFRFISTSLISKEKVSGYWIYIQQVDTHTAPGERCSACATVS